MIMIWLVLDKEKSPALFIDKNKVYAVVDVIKESNTSLQELDCSTSELVEEKNKEEQFEVERKSNNHMSIHR